MSAPPQSDIFVRKRAAFACPAAVIVGFAMLIVLAGPIGYRGGGSDDLHYLEAARCAAANGWCAPQTHWWSRFPVVAPTAGVLALAGEGRAQLAVVPLLYGLAAALLLARLLFERHGARAAALAGLTLLAAPVFGGMLLYPNIDLAELAFLLGALFALERTRLAGAPAWALSAGALLALAAQSRPSALCALPLAAAYVLYHPVPRTRIMLVAAGFCAPLLAEAAAYAMFTGDPLMPWRLALAHGAVPSTELDAGVDLTRSPILNPQFIGGWRPVSGIDAHWTIKGLLNLVVSPSIRATLLAAAVLLALAARGDGRDRLPVVLILVAGFYFAALVYGLGVDPKPRMFLPVVACATAIIGIAGERLWRGGRPLVPAAIVLVLCVSALEAAGSVPDLRRSDRLAAEWLRFEGSDATLDPTTASALALVPGARAARPSPVRRLALGDRGCSTALRAMPAGWRVAREAPIPTGFDGMLGRRPSPEGLNLCLFKRDRTPTDQEVGPRP